MKAYLIPYKPRRKLAVGEGLKLKGPVLYVPGKGAIFYEIDHSERNNPVVNVDSFEDNKDILGRLEQQIKGAHAGELRREYDLTQGLKEVDIADGAFNAIANNAHIVYSRLYSMRVDSILLIHNLEEKLGRDSFFL